MSLRFHILDCAIDIENSSWKPRFSMISRAFTNFLAQTARLVSSKSPWQAWLSFCGQGCRINKGIFWGVTCLRPEQKVGNSESCNVETAGRHHEDY